MCSCVELTVGSNTNKEALMRLKNISVSETQTNTVVIMA